MQDPSSQGHSLSLLQSIGLASENRPTSENQARDHDFCWNNCSQPSDYLSLVYSGCVNYILVGSLSVLPLGILCPIQHLHSSPQTETPGCHWFCHSLWYVFASCFWRWNCCLDSDISHSYHSHGYWEPRALTAPPATSLVHGVPELLGDPGAPPTSTFCSCLGTLSVSWPHLQNCQILSCVAVSGLHPIPNSLNLLTPSSTICQEIWTFIIMKQLDISVLPMSNFH